MGDGSARSCKNCNLQSPIFNLMSVFLVLYFLLGTLNLLAEEESFVYNSHQKRDPFFPVISEQGEFLLSPKNQESYSGDLVLEGIVWEEGGDSVAIINGKVVRQGETIAGYKVVWIKENVLLLQGDSGEVVLKMSPVEKGEGQE